MVCTWERSPALHGPDRTAVGPDQRADREAGADLVADVQRRLFRAPLQHAHEDQRVEREAPERGVDLRPAGGRREREGDAPASWTGCCIFRRRITPTRSRPGRGASCGTTRGRGTAAATHIGNRGVAILGESVFFVTPDCNLVSLDIKTGREKWFKEFCSLEMMYYGSVAPVVVKDRLIVGVSGDDLDQPAYLDARSPETGDLIWRWYVTPQKKDDPGLETWPNLDMAKHGGGMTWQPVTYDPELNLIYVTTGNPQPVVAYANRTGANLFTASIVALNADTGKMAWYFQSSPHDTHDWDATQTPVLFDDVVNGQPRKLLAQASRNGKFFVLDRTHGRAIVSTEYIKTNWSLGTDEQGQPIPNPEKRPQIAGALVTPNQGGATNWYSPSFSPQTGLFYVNANRAFSVWYIYDPSDNPMGWGGTDRGGYAEQGQLKAIDYKTGEIRWSIPRYGGNSGLLSTAGNVVFGSAASGHRRLQRDDGSAAVELPHRRCHQRPDYLRARWQAIRRRRGRQPLRRVRAE